MILVSLYYTLNDFPSTTVSIELSYMPLMATIGSVPPPPWPPRGSLAPPPTRWDSPASAQIIHIVPELAPCLPPLGGTRSRSYNRPTVSWHFSPEIWFSRGEGSAVVTPVCRTELQVQAVTDIGHWHWQHCAGVSLCFSRESETVDIFCM